jgi:hypothetical protein
MTEVKGLNFEDSFNKSKMTLADGISVRLIDYNHLLKAKKSSARSKDLDDLENLSEGK